MHYMAIDVDFLGPSILIFMLIFWACNVDFLRYAMLIFWCWTMLIFLGFTIMFFGVGHVDFLVFVFLQFVGNCFFIHRSIIFSNLGIRACRGIFAAECAQPAI